MEELLDKQDLTYKGITCDSRKVKKGYAFVAISGFNEDGNKFIDDAIKRGASIIFTEKDINKDTKIPIVKVEDARAFLGELASQFYKKPSEKLELIGVTGTNGKTTTSHLIYHLLNYANKKTGLIGTVKVDTGKNIKDGDLTTPPPVLLQKHLNEMVNNDLKYASMEVSSHGIKLKRINGTKFAVKIGTNISVDHFDLHSDFNDYIQVKKSFLKDNSKDTLVLINKDNKYLNALGKIATNQYNVGINSYVDIVAKEIKFISIGSSFKYILNRPLKTKNNEMIPSCEIPIKMNLPGIHNIYNALFAITVGLYYGVTIEKVINFFKEFKGVWRRLQIVYDNSFKIIDDCAHNPGSYEAVFKAVKNMEYNKLIVVNSLRGNRGVKINQENANIISKWLPELGDYLLYTSNCVDVVKPIDFVDSKEEKAFLQVLNNNNIQYTHFKKLEKALKEALNETQDEDLILLLGPHAMDHAAEMICEMI